MKKLFFLAVLTVLIVNATFSQVSYGLKGGMNLANITKNEGYSDMKVSFHAGGFAEFMLNDFFGISPELLYSRQGFQAKESGVTVRLRTNYLNIPVLAKFYVVNGLSLDVGPQIGFMLNSDIWAKYGGETITIDIPNDYMPFEMNKVDVSFAMGLTYNFNNFFVQGRYNLGLTDVVKDDSSHCKNSVIQFGVGYRF